VSTGVMTRRGAVEPPLYEIFDLPPSTTHPHCSLLTLLKSLLIANDYPHRDLGFHEIFLDGGTDFNRPTSDPYRIQKAVYFTYPSPGYKPSVECIEGLTLPKKLERCMKELGVSFFELLPDDIREKYCLRMVTILASAPGGEDQVTHIDYENARGEEALIMICPISKSPAKIVVNHTATRWVLKFQTSRYFKIPSSLCDLESLVVTQHQFLLFSSSLAHLGSSYSETNYRLHCVFFPRKVDFVTDSTYIMDFRRSWVLQWDSSGQAAKREEYDKKMRPLDTKLEPLLEHERNYKRVKKN
jgi:hypothetical protein